MEELYRKAVPSRSRLALHQEGLSGPEGTARGEVVRKARKLIIHLLDRRNGLPLEFYFTEQGVGFQPVASGNFLKSVVVMRGLVK